MKIYVSHSSNFDYKTELYQPLRAMSSEHTLFLPHADNTEGVLTRDVIPQHDLVVAEISLPSTGQGIELGWASDANVPIICLYRTGSSISSSLRFISSTFIEYVSPEDMVKKLAFELESSN